VRVEDDHRIALARLKLVAKWIGELLAPLQGAF
jgi:hypothetical protein